MNTFERRNQIISLLKEHGTVLVGDLSRRFNVSEVSIRTDLRVLEERRQLTRFHGGAGLITESTETLLEERYQLSLDPKVRIAQAAVKLIKEGDTITLDSGSTTMMIAQELLKLKNITVITNNLPAASILADSPDITLIVCGGTVRYKTRSMHGKIAENSLQGIRSNIMFVGADAIDVNIGLTTFNEGYSISAVMAEISAKVVAVVDATKFSRKGFNVVLPIEAVDLVITDSSLSSEYRKALEQFAVNVEIV